jgi:hypothetical protein
MGSRFNYRVGQFNYLSKKKNLLLEFSEAKNQRGKKKCTLGELWIVHNFSSHEKSNYLALRCTGKLSRYQS